MFEWLNTRPGFAGKVEIFGTWAVFADIFNGKRSGLPIRAGATLVDASDKSPRGELLNELYRTTTRLEGSDPLDSFLHVAVREHLRTHKPRVMFIGYGDTDSWQHMGRYDNLLETAHSFDGFMADLWQQIQSSAALQGSDHADHLDGSRARQRTRGMERPRHRAEGLEQHLDRGDRAGHGAARRAT